MNLFRSRRFWSAVIGVVMMVLVNFIPELNDQAETLTTAILVIVGLVIGGYTVDNTTETITEASIVKTEIKSKLPN